MRNAPLFFAVLGSLGLAVTACNSPTDGPADSVADAANYDDDTDRSGEENLSPEEQAELMRKAAIEAGIPTSDIEVPVVSARTYVSGQMEIDVSGHFEIDGVMELDRVASISDGDYTWLQYGTSGGEAPNATVTIGGGDISVSVAVGRYVATATSTECEMETDVTPTSVTGHFNCPEVAGYNQDDRSMENVAIEVEFDAGT
ncbi:MAG TPA: hypothetical protein VFY27_13195 [Woeseiaceae bacterium]|nr:hypothetical protein [Woeseiaceae bacterium]